MPNSKSETQLDASKSMEIEKDAKNDLPKVKQSRLGSVHAPYEAQQVGLFESDGLEAPLSVVDQAH